MSSVCEVCGKKPNFGMSMSHSHRRTKRRWNPNIQQRPRDRERLAQAGERLHVLPQGRQSRQAVAPEVVGMQGVVKMFDPPPTRAIVVRDADRAEFVLGEPTRSRARSSACSARVSGSMFDLDADGRATKLRSGAEPDLGPADRARSKRALRLSVGFRAGRR